MADHDRIKVWIDFENGETMCICPYWKKRCEKNCTEGVVTRDRYYGWEECLNVDIYGQVRGEN